MSRHRKVTCEAYGLSVKYLVAGRQVPESARVKYLAAAAASRAILGPKAASPPPRLLPGSLGRLCCALFCASPLLSGSWASKRCCCCRRRRGRGCYLSPTHTPATRHGAIGFTWTFHVGLERRTTQRSTPLGRIDAILIAVVVLEVVSELALLVERECVEVAFSP
jgi:hypothetical protein